jgi:hypothetical protein
VELNIHWLAPPNWSQWSVQYPLADTTKLVAMEFSISTGWHHKLVAVEFKFSLAGTINWSQWNFHTHWLAPILVAVV